METRVLSPSSLAELSGKFTRVCGVNNQERRFIYPTFARCACQGATEALGGEHPLGTPTLPGKRRDTNQTSYYNWSILSTPKTRMRSRMRSANTSRDRG